jgi:hypothetical protein
VSAETPVSSVVAAYIAEYGAKPSNREEQDRFSAFRFGYEAGVRAGAKATAERIVQKIEREAGR